jgi:cell wall-associated NlpC family hydrolase
VPFKSEGRDFAGWDCWGLIYQAYLTCFEIALPSFANVPALENWHVSDLYTEVRRHYPEVRRGQEAPGDVVVLRGLPVHIGLVVAKGLMLHVEKDISTCIEPYTGPLWKNKILGFYRYAEPAS